MKTAIKIYLEESEITTLKRKAEQAGYRGRGLLSRYFSKIANEPTVFIDGNVKAILESLKLKSSAK